MSNGTLPNYLKLAVPNPMENRAPWYKNTAPTYAGIFLWIGFYKGIAEGTLPQAGLGLSLLALVVSALLCHFLYYLVPGLLGMKTGYPLYVVGASTYGTAGGFLMPGLMMGLLQFGWLAVNTAVSTDFILQAAGKPAAIDALGKFHPSLPFTIICVIWVLATAFIGVKGIQYVAKFATFLNFVPLAMILIVFFSNASHAADYKPSLTSCNSWQGFAAMLTLVVGFFATAGAAGVDFGTGSRHAKDVQRGGLIGIALAIIVAGGLPLIAVAGAHAKNPLLTSYAFDSVIAEQKGLAGIMFILFAVVSFAPACFSSLIAANSFGTMFPKVNKMVAVFFGAVISIVLSATGLALNLIGVFSIIGASFGPICGAMAADYLLSGRQWAGPRKGVNMAGYISWAVGFVVAILPTIKPGKVDYITPAPVIAFIIGFGVYALLAKLGLQPAAVEMPHAPEKH